MPQLLFRNACSDCGKEFEPGQPMMIYQEDQAKLLKGTTLVCDKEGSQRNFETPLVVDNYLGVYCKDCWEEDL